MIAKMIVATATTMAWGTNRANVYVVTSVGDPAIPKTTTSLASMTVITRFHSRNHQLSPMNPRISSNRGRAIPNQPTRDLAM